MSKDHLFYLWLASWFLLEVIGAPLFFFSYDFGLLLMALGVADVLTPFIIVAQDTGRKRANNYFAKRKLSVSNKQTKEES